MTGEASIDRLGERVTLEAQTARRLAAAGFDYDSAELAFVAAWNAAAAARAETRREAGRG